jgi:hypothetical protein
MKRVSTNQVSQYYYIRSGITPITQSSLAGELIAIGGLLGEDSNVCGSVHHTVPQSADLGAIKHFAKNDPVIPWLEIFVALVQRKVEWAFKGVGTFAYRSTPWVLGIFAYF